MQKPVRFEGEVTMKVTMDYLLYLPPEYEQQDAWPLMLFLHGADERGDDLERITVHGPPKLINQGKHFPMVIASPQCAEYCLWNPQVLMKLIEGIVQTHKIDTTRIYLTGLSMGGHGAWTLAMEYPDVFAALVPICGWGDPDSVKKIKHVPTWTFHGVKDTIVPITGTQKLVDALRATDSDVKFTVYPDAYHDSWTETYENPELYEWLFKQKLAGI